MGLEGIVSKRLRPRYVSGRTCDWLKMKNPAAPAVKRPKRIGLLLLRQVSESRPAAEGQDDYDVIGHAVGTRLAQSART
jgi:hypothetical protein